MASALPCHLPRGPNRPLSTKGSLRHISLRFFLILNSQWKRYSTLGCRKQWTLLYPLSSSL
ncbi:hypothetical protein HPP92_020818 [Vanilla planifolia]|uniref:Uncharacterized protein n=1 Tax=Vanilla planifolia TaxID=51239 RepID=A0A835PUA7_VANPL|nr:hypothetical protein HPP92_020818 [Vanilla planifolia]